VTRRRSTRIAVVTALAIVSWHLVARHPGVGRAELPMRMPALAAGDGLVIEPDDGMAPIYALLRSPRRSLDLTMYELTDPTVEAVLAEDAARGVRVRVILDGRLERTRNLPAYRYLRGRGVAVSWSAPRFFATHEKAFVIDSSLAVVMSLVAVVDRDPRDVAAIDAVFAADLAGRPVGTPAADDLVWSPSQSQADLVGMIAAARRTLSLESEELSSETVLSALVAAARRGVAVRVVMTYDDSWRSGFARLAQAGASVVVMYGERPRYIHAKLMVADSGTPRARAFVGSENLSDASLLHDRELGIVLVAPSLVVRVDRVIAVDAADGYAWRD
jgi:phosphatidylserine/phosphatidylglycerophosphate/cardiolipin synthase-like enzyme